MAACGLNCSHRFDPNFVTNGARAPHITHIEAPISPEESTQSTTLRMRRADADATNYVLGTSRGALYISLDRPALDYSSKYVVPKPVQV
jgi:hypothetical protein